MLPAGRAVVEDQEERDYDENTEMITLLWRTFLILYVLWDLRLEFDAFLGHVGSVVQTCGRDYDYLIEHDLIMARESLESILMTVSFVLCNKYCVARIHSLWFGQGWCYARAGVENYD